MKEIYLPKRLTRKASKILAKYIEDRDVIGLVGGLGAGKTTFVKYIVRLLKSQDPVTSPTFTLLQTYSGNLRGKTVHINHFDLYRLDDPKEIETLLHEYSGKPNTITFIEWADKFPDIFPKTGQLIKILDEKIRK